MTEASFEVTVTEADARRFAELSGDWNPLHTDATYASRTSYGRPVLHGAFSAGLVSRMAGMYLPGRECLLHGMRLRFLAPIVPPATLKVSGRAVESTGLGRVDVSVSDASSSTRYVDASYEYGLHVIDHAGRTPGPKPLEISGGSKGSILVTGASGGIGGALTRQLGARAIGTSRRSVDGLIEVADIEYIANSVGPRALDAIVHCAWPRPDNQDLLYLDKPVSAIDHAIASPLRQTLALARLLRDNGKPGALLVLVGSTFAQPGRHGYRMPLYSLSKTLIPTLARILALELAPAGMRCAAVVFDVLKAGMNDGLNAATLQSHADRMPNGTLVDAAEAAGQIAWLLGNPSVLVSGGTINLSGGSLP